jgi:membrane dipeptidase
MRRSNSILGAGRCNQSRRRLLRGLAAGGAAYIAAPMLSKSHFQVFADSPAKYSKRAVDLIARSLVIDMLHPIDLKQSMSFFMKSDPYRDKDGVTAEKLARMRASGVDIFHASSGVGADHFAVMQYFNGINGFIANNANDFTRIDSVADIAKLKGSGKLGILPGTQNADHFHFMQPQDIETFYRAGQRVAQLTYNNRNLIGTGATDRSDSGLSQWGVTVIGKMNEIGMAIDVSHCGDRTSIEAAEVSAKPILITHSNSRTLAGGHPRCKPDEVIKAVASKGGVMGLSFVRIFVRGSEPTNIEHALDHFDYVRDLVGVEHLGIGSDADVDGYDVLPEEMLDGLRRVGDGKYRWRAKLDTEGLDHPQRLFALTDGLIRRGYSDSHIEGILGGNFKRVLSQIWR